jgi:hypothetical protein
MTTEPIEVALDIEGLGLRTGGDGDFVTLPSGSDRAFFYNGQLYEVVQVIATIGKPVSLTGSLLFDLLAQIYGQTRAAGLLAASKRIGGAPPGIVLAGQKQPKLIYVKLRPQPVAAPNL